MSYRDHTFSSSLWCEGFDVDEEIINMMNGTPQDEFNGYRCNISNDANNDGTLKRTFLGSMNEG